MDFERNRVLILISILFVVAHFLPGTMDLSFKIQKFWTFFFLYLSLLPYLLSVLQIFQSRATPTPTFQLMHLAYFIFLATLIIIRLIIHRETGHLDHEKIHIPPLPKLGE